MQTQIRRRVLVLLISTLALVFGSCSKEPSTANGGVAPGPKPFKGEVYRTIDDKKAITLTTPDELEMSENGVNLICKFTKPDDYTLRVVANIMGTAQALYFTVITDNSIPAGLRDHDGAIYFAPAYYVREKEKYAQIAAKKQWFEKEFLKSFDEAKMAGRLEQWNAEMKAKGLPTSENGEPPKWSSYAAQRGWPENP